MKKRTNGIIAILWGLGVVAMIVAMVIVRFRVDTIAEFMI